MTLVLFVAAQGVALEPAIASGKGRKRADRSTRDSRGSRAGRAAGAETRELTSQRPRSKGASRFLGDLGRTRRRAVDAMKSMASVLRRTAGEVRANAVEAAQQRELRRRNYQRFGTHKLMSLRDDVRRVRREARFDRLTRNERANAIAADENLRKVTEYSQESGNYFIVSDLHWGRGRDPGGMTHPTEAFRKVDAFVKFIDHASQEKRATLVIAGDWIDTMQEADAETPIDEVKRIVDRTIEGHRDEVRSLARAVTKNGMRILYTRGNHDVHLVDPEVREHMIQRMIDVAGLKGKAARRFRKRVAWAGFGAVLGKYGEGLAIHGDLLDSQNNWRSPVNPYNARGRLETNWGWGVVKHIVRALDPTDPALTGNDRGAERKIIANVLGDRSRLRRLFGELFPLASKREAAESVAEHLDDRLALRKWMHLSGFHAANRRQLPGAQVDRSTRLVAQVEAVFERMPEPVLSRFTSPIRLAAQVIGMATDRFVMGDRGLDRRGNQLIKLFGDVGNVRYVVWGHDHRETAAVMQHEDKGEIGHVNGGTWTETVTGWNLNVVVARTNKKGRLKMTSKKTGLHRTDDNGELRRLHADEITPLGRTPRPQDD